jgi:cell division protein FtsI (penicillin-binding protein 3)
VSAEAAAVTTELLRGVIEHGTGQTARIEGLSLAGKTGTAQKVDTKTGRYSPNARMGSFVAYGPVGDPRLVVLVVIDTPRKARYGGVVAAPAVRRIMQFGLEQRGIRPWTPPLPVLEVAAEAGAGAEADVKSVLQAAGRAGSLQTAVALIPDDIFAESVTCGRVPRLLGLSMRDALLEAHRAGLSVRLAGSGYVVAQEPPPGADPLSGEVMLALAPEAH